MLKKMFIITATILLLFSGSIYLFSTEEDKSVESTETASSTLDSMFTEEVEVVGNVPVINTIQSVSVLKNAEIKKYNFESLKSVLQMTPGLLTLSTGIFGQSSSTYIRGSKTTQVLYIVDGIKLRDTASISGVNLAVLSPTVIDKVEVVRGPLSSMYGSDAMGGVISINTIGRQGADFTASFGSHGSYNGGFSGSTKVDAFTLGLAVNTQRFSDDIDNDVFKNTGLSAKADFNNEKVTAGFRFFGNFTDSGIPFNNGLPTAQRSFNQDYYILAVPLTYNFNKQSNIDVKLSYSKSKYTFDDPEDTWDPYFMSTFGNYEAEVIYSGKFFEKLDIKTGIDYSNQKILNENNYGPTLDNLKMNYFSGFLSTGLNLGSLQFSAAVRVDKYKDVDSNVSPQFGISYLVAHKLKLRASYAHSFLAPTLSQQVNPWGDSNFALEPEKAKSFELGLEYYSEKFVLSASYFDTRYEDMIDWVTIDPIAFTGQYQNITKVDTSGIELSAVIRPISSLTFSGAYSYLKTENKDTGEPLARKPKHTFSAFASYVHKRFTVAVNMIYVGKRPDLDYSTWPYDVEAPSFNTFGLSLMVPITSGISVFGKITNAFDKEYQEVVGYTAPGRRFELGIKYKTN